MAQGLRLLRVLGVLGLLDAVCGFEARSLPGLFKGLNWGFSGFSALWLGVSRVIWVLIRGFRGFRVLGIRVLRVLGV